MRRIFSFMMVSLDGYFEGLNHELNWHNVDREFNDFAVEQLKDVDILLFGWRTYELMANWWPTDLGEQADPMTAGLMNTLPKIVFSRQPRIVEWQNTRLMTENIAAEIRKLKNQPGKNIAIFGSSNLCVSFIEMGLIDEFRIMINPVILGEGHTLFNGVHKKLPLKLEKIRRFDSGNILLYYQHGKSDPNG